jgi:hypothetical protein
LVFVAFLAMKNAEKELYTAWPRKRKVPCSLVIIRSSSLVGRSAMPTDSNPYNAIRFVVQREESGPPGRPGILLNGPRKAHTALAAYQTLGASAGSQRHV